MKDFIITTDTTTDLPASYVNEHHLGMMSLPYTIENQTYTWEHSLPEKEFYAMMRNGSLPTTSQANPEEAENLFENIIKTQDVDILHIAFSSGLSGTYNSCRLAAMNLAEKYPDNKIIVIDSLCASMGEGLFVHKAVMMKEEGKSIDYSIRESWEKLWIVDPLDGTKEFIKRNGEFTVNIALVINGVPELGVIYVPVKRTLYYGLTGYGAYKIENIDAKPENLSAENLRQFAIQLPIKREKRPFTVVASRSHLSPETASFIADLQQKHPDLVTTSIGSSIKICLVSEGNADIYPRFAPTMEWDTAAGHAIARAAGKEIYHTDRQTPISYNKENLLNPWFIVE